LPPKRPPQYTIRAYGREKERRGGRRTGGLPFRMPVADQVAQKRESLGIYTRGACQGLTSRELGLGRMSKNERREKWAE